jgi:uncharacterized protein YabE (DUF348 family)
MKIKFTLSIIVLITLSLYLFNSITAVNQHAASKPTISHTEELETYSYIVTSKDSKGIYGDSLTDDTGIFIDYSTLKGIKLNENDKIKVSFPIDDYETITKVTKIN